MATILRQKGCGQPDIDYHLDDADNDKPIYGNGSGDGQDRWRYLLTVVPLNKDEQAVQRVLDDLASGKSMVR